MMHAIKMILTSAALVPALFFSPMARAQSRPAYEPPAEMEYDKVPGNTPWKIWVKPHSVDRGTYVYKFDIVEVASPAMKVDFEAQQTWCVYRIFHGPHMVGSPLGGTGSVVHWDKKPVGTVHGGEVVHEATLRVGDSVIPLSLNGRRQFKPDATWGGDHIILQKKSTIGPFEHEAVFEFGSDPTSYLVTHSYTAIEPITAERFAGYRYVFMQMMPPEFNDWLRIDADGKLLTGRVTPSTGGSKDRVVWTERVQSLICFASAWNTGVVYSYPQAYEGLSHFVDRGQKDRKFRGILFTRDSYNTGDKLQWQMRVSVFDANEKNWHDVGLRLSPAPFPAPQK